MADQSIPERTEFLLFAAEDGADIEVRLIGETVWLSLDQMAELFQRDKSVISRHISNVFSEGELDREATVAFFATVQLEGEREVTREIAYHNLDVIISVGYRVKSHRGTQFRIWATKHIREYLIKGFLLNDDLLKRAGGGNYFEELLERIRDIRSSERVFWRKVLDIFSTSIDYDPASEVSKLFFATVQNKMHFAAHGKTAAEIIYSRADANRPNMGMTNWVGAQLTRSEAEIAKNYLFEDELSLLNRIVTLCLDFAELQAIGRTPIYMKDWLEKIDGFLALSGREILSNSGSVSRIQALERAHAQYDVYRKQRDSERGPVEDHFNTSIGKINKKEINSAD